MNTIKSKACSSGAIAIHGLGLLGAMLLTGCAALPPVPTPPLLYDLCPPTLAPPPPPPPPTLPLVSSRAPRVRPAPGPAGCGSRGYGRRGPPLPRTVTRGHQRGPAPA